MLTRQKAGKDEDEEEGWEAPQGFRLALRLGGCSLSGNRSLAGVTSTQRSRWDPDKGKAQTPEQLRTAQGPPRLTPPPPHWVSLPVRLPGAPWRPQRCQGLSQPSCATGCPVGGTVLRVYAQNTVAAVQGLVSLARFGIRLFPGGLRGCGITWP